MFAISGDRVQEGTYKSHIIHFGGTFKAIEWEWDTWLEKFEGLLKKLYWDEVHLHLRTELVGNYTYRYFPKRPLEVIDNPECPQPSIHWVFTGGPRRFLTSGPEYDTTENLIWEYEGQTWKMQSPQQQTHNFI